MKNRMGAVILMIAVLTIGGWFTGIEDVSATNGYFSHGYGVQSKALAGATTALPQSAFSAATNPAGMAWIGTGYDFNLAFFVPVREYTITGNPSGQPNTFPLTPGTVKSGSEFFVIPGLAANWALDPHNSLGVTIYGNGGMNTNYDTKTFNNPAAPVTSPTGVDLAQMFLTGTYARRLGEKHSVGASAIFSYQRFKAEGLQAFGGFSSDPTKLTDNDYASSVGFGARIGYLGKWFEGFSIGASYQTLISMGEFDDYAGLFAEQGDFNIPASWSVGVAYDVTDVLTLSSDIQQILYSQVDAVSNPMVPADFFQGILLGSDKGAGFGWEDMTIFKFGAQWEGLADLPFRFGYSYGEQPIPESEVMFNILAPGVIEQHFTFGFSREMCGNKEISVTVMHGLSKTVTGDNPMEVPGQQEIELKMHQWEFTLGFGF